MVYSPIEISRLIETHGVSDILLAMPSIDRSRRNQILQNLRDFHVHVRSLPDLVDLAQGLVTVLDIKELEPDDLLGRASVEPDSELMLKNIQHKIVLVTGAGGSIGSELCRQIIKAQPAKILLLDHSEFNLYKIESELSKLVRASSHSNEEKIIPILASVKDENQLKKIFSQWSIDTIYHAAAYKHVPLVECNPIEGVQNNVIGTFNLANLAQSKGVKNFVLISTDKAVRPTNVMGASKRFAELILQALADNNAAGTCFSMVRFGNVLDSSGSVVPLFREQIRVGGPITLTHAEVTRYFMTIPEAAQLVIQAGAMAKGGEVFVLDMGEPVKIYDLARRMVQLSGLSVRDELNPHGDIEIVITGLRPGEKLYEELLIGENPISTTHPRIMMARENFLPFVDLMNEILAIQNLIANGSIDQLYAQLAKVIEGYKRNN
jgi:FlaA1/EpsC-like NDP-sugar epimerase